MPPYTRTSALPRWRRPQKPGLPTGFTPESRKASAVNPWEGESGPSEEGMAQDGGTGFARPLGGAAFRRVRWNGRGSSGGGSNRWGSDWVSGV